jgi:hypothetical protein
MDIDVSGLVWTPPIKSGERDKKFGWGPNDPKLALLARNLISPNWVPLFIFEGSASAAD